MFETLLATIGVLFTPTMTKGVSLPGGLVASMVLGYLLNLAVIVGITLITNIVRALRWCRDDEGNFKSFGISYGIKKGILCGCFAIVASIAVAFIPVLRVPFTVISFIPGLGSMIDGFVLAITYLFSYVSIAYPIWGSC